MQQEGNVYIGRMSRGQKNTRLHTDLPEEIVNDCRLLPLSKLDLYNSIYKDDDDDDDDDDHDDDRTMMILVEIMT